LLVGLVCTVCGKAAIVQHQKSPGLAGAFVYVALPDIVFFGGVLLLIDCLYMAVRPAAAVRLAMATAALVLVWSILNTGWLIASGVQMQPGILKLLVRDAVRLWPFARARITYHIEPVVVLAAIVLTVSVCFLWYLIKPGRVVVNRVRQARRIATVAAAMALLLVVRVTSQSKTNSDVVSNALGFSSHWHAIVWSVTNVFVQPGNGTEIRNIVRAGERNVGVPQYPHRDLPNVVLVLLESASYLTRQPGADECEAMPNLARLAGEGVEFVCTRVPMPQTTKALWSVQTATCPVVQPNFVEAIYANQPYETLASILGKVGYRSAFFEMSLGTFECAPGLLKNLSFDWAWFRENLEDTSANLGYCSGDDFRMLEPAFEWATNSTRPFLLMMLTSVAHDPFEVPEWFGQVQGKPHDRYVHALRFTDGLIEQVCRRLKDSGLEENTIVCVLGDHGTSFRETSGNLRWTPYEEVIRIPWVMRWPGHIDPGQRIDRPCSQLDVTPTILRQIGFDVSRAGFEGKDVLTQSGLPDESELNRRLYFSSWFFNGPRGFVEGSRKVVYWPYIEKVFEYNLDSDPLEEKPILLQPADTDRVKQDILDWQNHTQVQIDPKRYTEHFLYSHWQIFSAGEAAWSYYVP